MKGFLMQKTTFAFEILIHDDASTDGTQEIIREYEAKYPDIIKPIYQTENQYSKGINISISYNLPRTKGKYIAFCEGDDYWTDKDKLQKQVDFLENHSEYSLCSHRFKVYNIEEAKYEPEWEYYKEIFANNPDGISFTLEDNFLKHWLTKVLTTIIRKESIISVDFLQFTYFRDVHLFYYTLKEGKGFCLNFFGGVYNRHFGGVHSKIAGKANTSYNVYKDLYVKNRDDAVLKQLFRTGLMQKVYTDILNPQIQLKHSVKTAFEPFIYGGDVKTTFYALRRIFRDRLWRIKHYFSNKEK